MTDSILRSLTLEQWRSHPELVHWMQKLMDDPKFQQFLCMLCRELALRSGTPVMLELDNHAAYIKGQAEVLSWIEKAAMTIQQ